MIKKRCKTCKFFAFEETSDPSQGPCKRFPPNGDNVWSSVRSKDTACGEYIERK